MSEASKPMTCKHVVDALDDYRRGTLPGGQAAEIKSHLESCDKCSAELAGREVLGQLLRDSIPAAPPPRTLSPAIKTTILQAQHPDDRARRTGSKNLLPWMLAAAVVLVTGVALVQMRAPRQLVDAEIASTAGETRLNYDADYAVPAQAEAAALAKSDDALQQRQEFYEAKPERELSEAATAPPPLQPMMQAPPQAAEKLALQGRISHDKAETAWESVEPAKSTQTFREVPPADHQVASRAAEARSEQMPGTFTTAGYAPPARDPYKPEAALERNPQYVRSRGRTGGEPSYPSAAAAVPAARRSQQAPMAATAPMSTTATVTSATLTTQTATTTAPVQQTTATETSAPR